MRGRLPDCSGRMGAMISDVSAELPAAIAARIGELDEFRMGVHRVGGRLTGGGRFDDVLVSV